MIKDSKSQKFSRDVTRRTKRGRRALAYFSRKNNSTEIRVESALEKDAGLLLEADPRVIAYSAQPFVLELTSNAIIDSKQDFIKSPGVEPRFYTPDFECRLDDGSLLVVEAKNRKFLKEFETRRADIVLCLKGHGKNFLLLQDDQFDATAVRNITRLHVLRANYQDKYVAECSRAVSALIENKPKWKINDLAKQLVEGKSAVFCALITGVLCTDLRKCMFSDEATVSAAHGELKHFEILELSRYDK